MKNIDPLLSNYSHHSAFRLGCLLNNTGHTITSHYDLIDRKSNKYILKAEKLK